MSDYNSNNRRGDDRGGSRFGGRDSGRRGFGGGRDFGRPAMHKATCAECGNDCEVPFQPTGDRPVYCSNCFESRRKGDSNSRGTDNRNFQRPNFEERRSYSPSGGDNGRRAGTNDNGQLLDQLKSLNIKLDKIISFLEPRIEKPKESKREVIDIVSEPKPVKPKVRKIKAKMEKSEISL